jgi:hypothetical protein
MADWIGCGSRSTESGRSFVGNVMDTPSPDSNEGFERVYTFADYFDGPRSGVADFEGRPHFYDCIFSREADNFTNQFQLTPTSQEGLALALEDWAIWCRWQVAFRAGEATLESHPTLPEDQARHQELRSILEPVLRTDPRSCILRYGLFRLIEDGPLNVGGMRDLQVRWTVSNDSETGSSLYR